MIKKIVCPVDFSETSINAVEYAASLAKAFGVELLLLNLQQIAPVSSAVSMGEGITAEVRSNSRIAQQRFKDMCLEIKMEFDLEANFEVDISGESLVKTLKPLSGQNTLIVMGSNGADDMYQYFFGSNTYQVIKEAQCPILLIPEGVSYSLIQKIVFAWDYSEENKFSFSFLYDFMKNFNPVFVFLHISKRNTEISLDIFNALRSEIIEVLGVKSKIEFEQFFSENIPETLINFMSKSQANMLSLTYYDRGILRSIFQGNITRDLSETANFPLLVMHA